MEHRLSAFGRYAGCALPMPLAYGKAGGAIWPPKASFIRAAFIFCFRDAGSIDIKTKKGNNPRLLPQMGLGRLGLPTSRLSGVRSNRLSYKPEENLRKRNTREVRMTTRFYVKTFRGTSLHKIATFRTSYQNPLKEVIQPQVPLRLPCYDFTPVAVRSVGGCLPCGLAHRLRVQTTPMV